MDTRIITPKEYEWELASENPENMFFVLNLVDSDKQQRYKS